VPSFSTCSLSYLTAFSAEQFTKYDREQYQKYDTEFCNLQVVLRFFTKKELLKHIIAILTHLIGLSDTP